MLFVENDNLTIIINFYPIEDKVGPKWQTHNLLFSRKMKTALVSAFLYKTGAERV